LVQRLCDFADGVPVDFDDWEVETEGLTDFGRQVIAACRKIPWGTTCTYGQLAELAGRPGAARAVGSVMARNRVPLVVPCHRVVPAGGGLGGFSAPQGVAMKRRLLQNEQLAAALWR
jgi:methylated-DNA-[protein]-cysteine S-methyltransferase